MERGKTLLLATLLLSGALLAGCGDDEEATSTDMTNPVQPAPENPGEGDNPPVVQPEDEAGSGASVSTGTTGTTSGITGSDMVEPDETTDEGLSANDQMPVSDPSAQASQSGPSSQGQQSTQGQQSSQGQQSTPEQQSAGSPSGGGQDGVPQASSQSTSQAATDQQSQ
jgi:hypothetical protein